MGGVAEREDALLGARFLLVAAGAAEGRVKTVFVERLAQPNRLHDVGVHVRTVVERVDVVAHAVLVDVHQKVEAELFRHVIAKGDHLAELPGGVDMQEGKWRLGRIKGLHRQVH